MSRPEGLGVEGLPLRPAEVEALLELELELELELLDDDGMEADGDDEDEDEEELEGIDGMELCDDCCWLVDSQAANTRAMAPASKYFFDIAMFIMSCLSN